METNQTSDPVLYDQTDIDRLLQVLTDSRYFDPAYILLFGKLAGGTPHSDAAAYDLLVVCHEKSEYDWIAAKRLLRYTFPYGKRKIKYINLYITTVGHFDISLRPHLYFAHAEGKLLYCSDRFHFRRPRKTIDFKAVEADARNHYDTFRIMGEELLEQAHEACFSKCNRRLAATLIAQAVVYYYHTLYYVYHGEAFNLHDPVLMHARMRTLSAQLMLAFDDNLVERIFMLPTLRDYLNRARYDIRFDVEPQELEQQLDRVERAVELIEFTCEERINLYKELGQ